MSRGTSTNDRRGSRTGAKRNNVIDSSDDIVYVRLAQGIYSIHSPIIESSSQLRAGECGTPFLRIGNKRLETTNGDGEIVEFWGWADIKESYENTVFLYAQVADPLIEDGWNL